MTKIGVPRWSWVEVEEAEEAEEVVASSS